MNAELDSNFPVLVTLAALPEVPTLRHKAPQHAIREGIRLSQTPDFRVVHFVITEDHVHVLVEADDLNALTTGSRRLVDRLAEDLDRAFERRGAGFRNPSRMRVLRDASVVREALRFVLIGFAGGGGVPRTKASSRA
jgi:putative transposase